MLVLGAGGIVFLFGWQYLRILAFPLAFPLLMVPIPAILFNQIAFPLQLLASRFGAGALQACSVPVLREGNVIVLANTTLEVAEACSGIRSLISLLTLGIVYGYFSDPRTWVRVLIALTTVPIAIVANGLRVAGTGIAAHYYGPAAAQGFFHTFSGWLVFVFAFALLFGFVWLVRRFVPPAGRPPLRRWSHDLQAPRPLRLRARDLAVPGARGAGGSSAAATAALHASPAHRRLAGTHRAGAEP